MKLAKSFLFTCACLFYLYDSSAQVTNFKMSDYKYRTPGLKALSLNGNLNSIYGKAGPSPVPSMGTFGLNPTISYLKLLSLDKTQFEIKQTATVGLNKMSEADLIWTVNYQADWLMRMYKGNKFLQYGSNSIVNVMNGNLLGKNQVFNTIGLNPHIGVGIGRLEYISNAQMALFILNDLKDAGKIKGTVSESTAQKFTDLITELYNTRIFDFRIRRNYEVTKIDSFLRANKVISGTDIEIYNIISDNWNYAIQPNAIEATSFTYGTLMVSDINRFSDRINQFGIFGQPRRFEGVRKTVSLTLPSTYRTNPNFGFNPIGFNPNEFIPNLTDSTLEKFARTDYGARLVLLYENHHALSLKRQRVYGFSFAYYHDMNSVRYQFSNRGDSTTNGLTSNIILGGDYGFQYYPNSRTVLQAVGNLSVSRNGGNNNQVALSNIISTVVGANVTASWLINYRSRISGNCQLSLNNGGSNTTSNVSLSVQYVNFLF